MSKSHSQYNIYINSEKSFKDIDSWLKDLKNYASPDVKVMLIGNKKDLEGDRIVSTIDGQKLKEDYGLDYFIETSAKTSENVSNAFENSVRTIISKVRQDPLVLNTNKSGVIELRKDNDEQRGYLNYFLSWC